VTSFDQHIIAADQRLSQSLIWQIQRLYFQQKGMQAWQADEVPHTISSNPYMARAYAQVVLGYLRDCAAAQAVDPKQPIYIVELGAGSGRLAYHFLHQFFPRWQGLALADWPIKFVMTDFVPEILDFWQGQARFQPWIEAGVLDFALFDVMEKRPLTLHHAHITLTPDRMANPLILIANYFFDSIPQDSFVIEAGQLCQNLLTLLSHQPEPDLADPTIWERLELAYEAIPLAEPPYEEPVYNQILAGYEAILPDTAVSFPNIGLDCVRYWQGFGNGRALLLSADRGVTLLDSLVGQDVPLPNLHGSFSLMVNYHAIGQYVELTGGQALHPAQYQDNLQVAAFLLGPPPQDGRETRQAFADAIGQAGPDDFFAIKQALEPHLDSLTLPQMLSYLRLSVWDTAVFHDCFPTLLTQVEQADPVWYEDVVLVLRHIWERYLPLGEDDVLTGRMGQLLAVMGMDTAVLNSTSQQSTRN
jgi:hypothetical protein